MFSRLCDSPNRKVFSFHFKYFTIMGNCKKGSNVAAMDQEVRRSYIATVNAANGIVATLKVVNDITGNWKNADASKAYGGIIPVVGSTERYDLAFTQYDLLSENIPSFPKGDEVEFFTPQDDLHKIARDKFTEGITLKNWLDAIVTALPAVRLVALPYSAHNKSGGVWQSAILGAEKV